MTVRWVFSRGDRQTTLEIVCLPDTCSFSIHRTDRAAERIAFPTIMEAMLRQAILERELMVNGWELCDFQRLSAEPRGSASTPRPRSV
jgi:hypothetical protein